MDILFAIRADYQERIGGDTFQFLFTKKYLEKNYGTNIIVLKTPEEIENYPDVKAIHIFNTYAGLYLIPFAINSK